MTRPYLLSFGDDVNISTGFVVLINNFGWSVFKGVNGAIIGNVKPVTFGNNIFVGFNVIIPEGVTIGDNVIIGAGSVVTKSIPSNEVWAGNPAHYICKIDEYISKRESLMFHDDAEAQFLYYYRRFNQIPNEEELPEFFVLWHNIDDKNLNRQFLDRLYANGCNKKLANEYYFNNTIKVFKSYERFVEHCLKLILQNAASELYIENDIVDS